MVVSAWLLMAKLVLVWCLVAGVDGLMSGHSYKKVPPLSPPPPPPPGEASDGTTLPPPAPPAPQRKNQGQSLFHALMNMGSAFSSRISGRGGSAARDGVPAESESKDGEEAPLAAGASSSTWAASGDGGSTTTGAAYEQAYPPDEIKDLNESPSEQDDESSRTRGDSREWVTVDIFRPQMFTTLREPDDTAAAMTAISDPEMSTPSSDQYQYSAVRQTSASRASSEIGASVHPRAEPKVTPVPATASGMYTVQMDPHDLTKMQTELQRDLNNMRNEMKKTGTPSTKIVVTAPTRASRKRTPSPPPSLPVAVTSTKDDFIRRSRSASPPHLPGTGGSTFGTGSSGSSMDSGKFGHGRKKFHTPERAFASSSTTGVGGTRSDVLSGLSGYTVSTGDDVDSRATSKTDMSQSAGTEDDEYSSSQHDDSGYSGSEQGEDSESRSRSSGSAGSRASEEDVSEYSENTVSDGAAVTTESSTGDVDAIVAALQRGLSIAPRPAAPRLYGRAAMLDGMDLQFDSLWTAGLYGGGQSTVLRFVDSGSGRAFAVKVFNKMRVRRKTASLPMITQKQADRTFYNPDKSDKLRRSAKAYLRDVGIVKQLGNDSPYIQTPIAFHRGTVISDDYLRERDLFEQPLPENTWDENLPALSRQKISEMIRKAIDEPNVRQQLWKHHFGTFEGGELWIYPMVMYEFAEHTDLFGYGCKRPHKHKGDPIAPEIRRRFRTTSELLFIAYSMLSAFAHMHERSIVHNDIKPDNILQFADGSVKLTDFGLAAHVTAAGNTVGSLNYVPPEFFHETARLGPPRDLFSLGIVLVELALRQDFWDDFTSGIIQRLVDIRKDRGMNYKAKLLAMQEIFTAHWKTVFDTIGKLLGDAIVGPSDERVKLLTLIQSLLQFSPDDRGTAAEHVLFLSTDNNGDAVSIPGGRPTWYQYTFVTSQILDPRYVPDQPFHIDIN